MSNDDLPPSAFLQDCINGDVPLASSQFADANLARLLSMTRDPHSSNRDWAVFLVAELPIDNAAIRAALLRVADHDDDYDVRDQALIGLARRDKAAALDRVATLLANELTSRLLKTAGILADPLLLPLLRNIESWSAEDSDRIEEDAVDSDIERKWLKWAIYQCDLNLRQDLLYQRGLRIRYERALGLWMPVMWHLALRGHTGAMIELADWFSDGVSTKSFGTPTDPFSAAGLYYRAYRKGDARAAYNAAMSCFNRNDMIGYRQWLRRAAKAGDAEAGKQLRYFETRLWHSDARKVARLRPKQKRDEIA
jgi:hypothetical protein